MGKSVKVWLLSLVLMAPCVYVLGAPLVFLAYFWLEEEIRHWAGRSGSHYYYFAPTEKSSISWIFIASIFLIFVAGVVMMIRNSLADRNRE